MKAPAEASQSSRSLARSSLMVAVPVSETQPESLEYDTLTRGSAWIAWTLSVLRSVRNQTVPGSSKSCVPMGVDTSVPSSER